MYQDNTPEEELYRICGMPRGWGDVTADAKSLINDVVDLHYTGPGQMTFLHNAALRGQTGLCELLLDSGAMVNTENANQRTPLECAAVGHKYITPPPEERYVDTCKLLLKHGADPEKVTDQDAKETIGQALQELQTEGWVYQPAAPQSFVKPGEKTENLTKRLEALCQRPEISPAGFQELSELVAAGADINTQSNDEDRHHSLSMPPLHYAVYNEKPELCQALLDNGANVHLREKFHGRPALHIAAANGDDDICKLLLDHGANVNAENQLKSGPLKAAAANEHSSTCKLLLLHGADPEMEDTLNNRPSGLNVVRQVMDELKAENWEPGMPPPKKTVEEPVSQPPTDQPQPLEKSEPSMPIDMTTINSLDDIRQTPADRELIRPTKLTHAVKAGQFQAVIDRLAANGEQLTTDDYLRRESASAPTVIEMLAQQGRLAAVFTTDQWKGDLEGFRKVASQISESVFKEQLGLTQDEMESKLSTAQAISKRKHLERPDTLSRTI